MNGERWTVNGDSNNQFKWRCVDSGDGVSDSIVVTMSVMMKDDGERWRCVEVNSEQWLW